jgi:hypothetical protein
MWEVVKVGFPPGFLSYNCGGFTIEKGSATAKILQ